MPLLTTAALRKQLATGETDALFALVGADDAEKAAVAGEFADMVDEGLRAFNVERLYGGEIKVDRLIDSAMTLPMMAPRRVILVLEAEKLFVPKRESEAAEEEIQRRATLTRGARLDPFFGVGRILDRPAVDDVPVVDQRLDRAAPLVEGAAHEDHGGALRRSLDERDQALLLLVRRRAVALGNEELFPFDDQDDPARRHHRQRHRRIDQPIDFDLAAVEPFDVEGPQPLVDHVGELPRHRRLLRVVGANQR